MAVEHSRTRLNIAARPVSLSVANEAASLPIVCRLYLPQAWAADPEQRDKAKIPPAIAFQTKPQIALGQIEAAKARGVAPGVVPADAGYGADGGFRAGLTALGLAYVVGVQPTLSVWRPGEEPLPAKPWSGKGRPPSRLRRGPDVKPISAKALAEQLPGEAWQSVTWREGTNIDLRSRFAAVRLRPASRDFNRSEPHDKEWLMIEWPEDTPEPIKYWLRNDAARHATPRLGQNSKVAMAYRTGLSGTQTGTWIGPLRRSRMARVPSPCEPVHRRLRIPHRLSWDDSPSAPAPSQRGPTPRLPNRRRSRAPPVRPVPTSITTMRRRLTIALVQRLS